MNAFHQAIFSLLPPCFLPAFWLFYPEFREEAGRKQEGSREAIGRNKGANREKPGRKDTSSGFV
jgi:hypothetical protein